MTYIYDVTLNFNEILYDFFEWNNTDNLIHVRKIPIIKVSSEDFKNIITYKIKINELLLNKIIDKTETYGKKVKKMTSCLISDNENIIALKFNSEGISTDISSIIVEEELDILEIRINNSKTFEYETISPRKFLTTTRYDSTSKNYIEKEIRKLNIKKDKEKIKYLYLEYFGKYTDDESKALNELKKELKLNNNLEDLFKLTSNNN